MAEDKEVLKEVWEGRIPVRFELAAADVSTMEPPDHYFVSLYSSNSLTSKV